MRKELKLCKIVLDNSVCLRMKSTRDANNYYWSDCNCRFESRSTCFRRPIVQEAVGVRLAGKRKNFHLLYLTIHTSEIIMETKVCRLPGGGCGHEACGCGHEAYETGLKMALVSSGTERFETYPKVFLITQFNRNGRWLTFWVQGSPCQSYIIRAWKMG